MEPKYQLDLHTHSIISYDGGITDEEYRKFLRGDDHRFLAITDHNEISMGLELKNEFGDRVIVGEEIKTTEGEIIGLYLTDLIPPGLSCKETVAAIRKQGGLVYVPHAFEIRRQGLNLQTLSKLSKSIDIMEVFNARGFEPWTSRQAEQFAAKRGIAVASSSDAHSLRGLGTACSLVAQQPTRQNLVRLLEKAHYKKQAAPLWSFLAPMRNKLKKKLNL